MRHMILQRFIAVLFPCALALGQGKATDPAGGGESLAGLAKQKSTVNGPAPRTADGKPDLSGVWNGPGAGSYDRNIARDLQPSDIQPWAAALYQKRVLAMGKDAPRANCLPDPFTYYHMVDLARIVQTPALLVVLYQGTTNSVHRTIFTDGRDLPKDPNPTWMGY